MIKLIQYFQFIFPNQVANIIYKHMSNPRVRKLRESEEIVLNAAIQTNVDYNEFSLKRYEWGEENEEFAFLVHGWEG